MAISPTDALGACRHYWPYAETAVPSRRSLLLRPRERPGFSPRTAPYPVRGAEGTSLRRRALSLPHGWVSVTAAGGSVARLTTHPPNVSSRILSSRDPALGSIARYEFNSLCDPAGLQTGDYPVGSKTAVDSQLFGRVRAVWDTALAFSSYLVVYL